MDRDREWHERPATWRPVNGPGNLRYSKRLMTRLQQLSSTWTAGYAPPATSHEDKIVIGHVANAPEEDRVWNRPAWWVRCTEYSLVPGQTQRWGVLSGSRARPRRGWFVLSFGPVSLNIGLMGARTGLLKRPPGTNTHYFCSDTRTAGDQPSTGFQRSS